MIKISGIVIISLLLIIFLKESKREFAFILSLGVSVILFVTLINDFQGIISAISNLSNSVENISNYISLLVKILCISLLSQFVIDLCRDAGENALASQTEIASKILILVMTLPLFESVIEIITGLLK